MINRSRRWSNARIILDIRIHHTPPCNAKDSRVTASFERTPKGAIRIVAICSLCGRQAIRNFTVIEQFDVIHRAID
jgi:hypothetical protein